MFKRREIPGDIVPGIDPLFSDHGILKNPEFLGKDGMRNAELYYSYRCRAEIALDVCSHFQGGHYLEFGSDGMGTFRNFLSAFRLFDLATRHPNTEFWAFDIFGAADHSTTNQAYFDEWRGPAKFQQAKDFIAQHGLFVDHCHVVQGFFENTLTADLAKSVGDQGIGFAFLDCNIAASYATCFDFLADLMRDQSFVYMDEYFVTKEVPSLFDALRARLERRGMRAHYMRNAGGFGALYKLMPHGAAS